MSLLLFTGGSLSCVTGFRTGFRGCFPLPIRCDTHSPILEVRQIARNLNAMVEDFIAGVSHELKTPLTAIEGYAVLLGNRTSPRRNSVSTPRRFWTAPGGSPGW